MHRNIPIVIAIWILGVSGLGAASYDPADFDQVIEDREFDARLLLQGAQWNRTLVRNCRFVGTAEDGILLRDVQHVVIANCHFRDIRGQAAIRLSISGSTRDVTGNRVTFYEIAYSPIPSRLGNQRCDTILPLCQDRELEHKPECSAPTRKLTALAEKMMPS